METGRLGPKPINVCMDPNAQLDKVNSVDFVNTRTHKSSVGKLIYLTTILLDISFDLGVVNQHMES